VRVRVNFWKSFSRAQVASFVATAADFGFLVLLVEKAGVWYVTATALAALLGAVINFTMNRRWSFQASTEALNRQALRYAMVSGGSLILNSAGVYAFTEGSGISYIASSVLTSILVGVFFNFPLQRYFVFSVPVAGNADPRDGHEPAISGVSPRAFLR